MLLIKGAEVYAPEYLGKQDVLIAGGKIEKIGTDLPEYEDCQVIDGTGKIVTPGIIDRHVHVTGGGGEGSFHTQAPPVQLSKLIAGGVTTVVGLLGTDGISRSVENLVAKVKSLKEEGISAYCLCGAYGYPCPTITGDIRKDIMFVDEIIGLKLAISDHRAPNITTEELIRLGTDRILTSGLKEKAAAGAGLLKELQENYGNQIQLLAGSGINADNAKALLEETGLTQVHSSCRDWKRDETTTGPWVNYCFAPVPHENDYDAVNETLVRKLKGSV